MATYKQLPGILPLEFISGNDFIYVLTINDTLTDDIFTANLLDSAGVNIVFPIVVNVVANVVTLTLTAAQTATLAGTYNWYLDRTHNSILTTFLMGTVTAIPKGTQWEI